MKPSRFLPTRHPGISLFARLGRCLLALGFGITSTFAFAQASTDTISWTKPYVWLPDGQTTPGTTITLQSSSGVIAGTTYQWFFNGAPIAGATGAQLTLTGVTVAQTGNYHYERTNAGGTHRSAIATVNVRAQSEPLSPVDTTFTAQMPDDGKVWQPVGAAADGSIIVVHDASGDYLRLRVNGSVDSAWVLPDSAGSVLHVAADGSVITSHAPYRFDVNAVARPLVLPAHLNASEGLDTATTYSDGRVLVTQTLPKVETNSNGQQVTRSVTQFARFLADGSVDGTFVGVGELAGTVTKLTIDSAGRILVGRQVMGLTSNGTGPVTETPLSSYTFLFRLNTDGTNDTSFSIRSVPHPYYLIWNLRNDGQILTANTRGVQLWALRDANGGDVAGASGVSTSFQPYTVTPDGRLFGITSSGPIERWTNAATPVRDLNFYDGVLPGNAQPNGLRAFDDQTLYAWGSFTSWSGHASNRLFRLRTTDNVTPQFTVSTYFDTHQHNIPTRIASVVQGGGAGDTYEWFALDGQPLPADRFSATLDLGPPHFSKLGRYQVRVSGANGSLLSQPLLVAASRPMRLLGLSGRAEVGTGEDVLVAGAVVQTSAGWPQKILVRGAGPMLRQYGLDTALTDPALAWFEGTNPTPVENDNWADTDALRAATATAGLSPFAPGSLDSALLQTWVTPGNYTVHLRNRGTQEGIGLLELYDLGSTRTGEFDSHWGDLAGLSLRARVGAGDKVAIGGFIIRDPHELGGGRYQTVLIRATGPALAQYGIARPLSNPRLTIYNAAGEVIASNDDWNTNVNSTRIFAAAASLGLNQLQDGGKDSALLVDLPAGPYTAQVSTGDGTTGVALLEIYRVRGELAWVDP